MFAKKSLCTRSIASKALSLLLAFTLLCSTFTIFAAAECSHTNQKKLPLDDGYEEISGDDVYHYYITYYKTICSDCQTILVSQSEERTKEKHNYGYSSQGMKRCSYCKHEAEIVCEHTNQKKLPLDDGYEEISGDDVYHYYITYYQTICSDCQTILVSQSEERTKEKHSYGYSSQGIKRCSYCDHEAEIVCEHTNQKTVPLDDGYEEISGDDVYHYYITYYKTICSDCQTILVAQSEERTKEEHSYGYSSSGKKRCSYCNHEATVDCEHKNEQQIYLDEAYKPITGDDVYHNHITYYQTRCEDCQTILVSQYEDIQKEAHTFDSEGNCSVCHYSKSTEQPEKLPDPVVKVAVNGTTAEVTWDAIDGAVRYVCSLHNMTTDKDIFSHVATNGLRVSLNDLEPGAQYRVAIGAVPEGVTDTVAETKKCSWGEKEFTIPAEGKLPDPVVKVAVNGTTAEVTWDAIDGAVRYVCSLHNMTTDKDIFSHVATNGLRVSLNDLEPGAQYRVAIGAVPEGVTDTVAETKKCSWGTKEFTIPAEGKLPDPVVKVAVNGTTAEVTWDAIDGAVRYVCSLHNMTTDKDIFSHVATNGLRVSLNDLEPGAQYRVAIGAVPEGVTDTVAETKKCSWGEKEFEVPRLAKPNVTVTVDGATMIASWAEVPGATRYVFSLRETSKPEGDPLYKHAATDGCSIMLSLEPGTEYKLAVTAVPFGVEDTEKDAKKCSWAETIFTTETLEEINTPKVLEVKTDMRSSFLLPGEKVTITVVCNKVTEYLDVYDPNYQTLRDPKFNKDGYPYFEYTLSYADVGKKELRFVALDAELNWSREKKHQGFLELIVCDHTPTETVTGTIKLEKKDKTYHIATQTYEKACLCGKIKETGTRQVDEMHSWGALQTSKTHTQGRGHRRFYQCACGEVKDHDYVSFSKTYAENKKCSTCRARYELIKELQTLLNERGYNAGNVDGIFGNNTKNAMNAFRRDVMGLPAIDDVDDATMAALRNGNVPPTPEDTEDPETDLITSPFLRWSMSYPSDRAVNIKVETDAAQLQKGTYVLLISSDGGKTYQRSRQFFVNGAKKSVDYDFDIYNDLKLEVGHVYRVAAAPLNWKSGEPVSPVGTIDLQDKAGFITSPTDGDSIAFFNTGALRVQWKKQSASSVYTVELIENGKQIYYGSTRDTYMLIKLSDIKSYTKDDWYVSHNIQINVMSIE